jgi:hypothetical protein
MVLVLILSVGLEKKEQSGASCCVYYVNIIGDARSPEHKRIRSGRFGDKKNLWTPATTEHQPVAPGTVPNTLSGATTCCKQCLLTLVYPNISYLPHTETKYKLTCLKFCTAESFTYVKFHCENTQTEQKLQETERNYSSTLHNKNSA